MHQLRRKFVTLGYAMRLDKHQNGFSHHEFKKNASNKNIIMMVESDGGTFPDPGGSSTIEREEHRFVLAWPPRCCPSTVPYSRKEGLKHPESAAGTECLN